MTEERLYFSLLTGNIPIYFVIGSKSDRPELTFSIIFRKFSSTVPVWGKFPFYKKNKTNLRFNSIMEIVDKRYAIGIVWGWGYFYGKWIGNMENGGWYMV